MPAANFSGVIQHEIERARNLDDWNWRFTERMSEIPDD
jgi:hypothetical protein